MWNLKNESNEETKQNRNKLIKTGNKLVVTRGMKGLEDKQNRWLRGTDFHTGI